MTTDPRPVTDPVAGRSTVKRAVLVLPPDNDPARALAEAAQHALDRGYYLLAIAPGPVALRMVVDGHADVIVAAAAEDLLADGTSVVCTTDHPWLADQYDSKTSGGKRRWVRADQLLEKAPYVLRLLDTWDEARTYEAGWLSGMFDGEGSIHIGQASKLGLLAAAGPDGRQGRRPVEAARIRSRGIPAPEWGSRHRGRRRLSRDPAGARHAAPRTAHHTPQGPRHRAH